MASQLESLHPKFITHLVKKLYDDDAFTEELYDDVDKFIDLAAPTCRVFGIYNIDHEDYEFLYAFFDKNQRSIIRLYDKLSNEEKNKLINSMVIPKSLNYEIEYFVSGNAYIYTTYRSKVESYYKDKIAEQLGYLRGQGMWDTWEGQLINTDYDNFEEYDWGISEITEVSNLNESIKSKKTLNSLNKSQLLKLREMIDEKLSRF